jgi:lipopolysaccharide transport system ATP-binding protein
MKNNVAIKVENLGKKYVINHEVGKNDDNFREMFVNSTKKIINKFNPFNKPVESSSESTKEDFWALNDINFEINRGDKVGIIGRNGAGKSTLLKVLSRITEPTTGKIHINGRIASLLEVGTGFHPELTGRENIYLNGAILGMSRKEIKTKFDEIVAFAEVDKFLDTPVKRYSSGMYVRLAFSVAAHLEPEILVVDEVLAVGDAAFQKKCLGKMDDVAKEGRTILFVSHNMQAIKQLCNKFISLKDGELLDIGDDELIISEYLSKAYVSSSGLFNMRQIIDNLPIDPIFKLKDIKLIQDNNKIFTLAENGKDISISIKYDVLQKISGLRLYIDITDDSDTLLFRSFHDESHSQIPVTEVGSYLSTVNLPKNILGPVFYNLKIHAGIHNVRNIFTLEFPLNIENTGLYNQAYLGDSFRGKLGLHLNWETKSNTGRSS